MKFKLIVTTTKEFETDLSDYPGDCKTPEDARKYEEANATDDPFFVNGRWRM
jgi:hypothetical protein